METLIVSGATGALGQRTITELEKWDVVIYALERKQGTLKKTDRIIPITVNDFWKMNTKLKNMIVLNMAFPRKADGQSVMEGIDFTRKFAEHCRTLGAQKIINISSQSVYNPQRRGPASELDITSPESLYGVGKDYCEKWLNEWSRRYNVPVINARMASLVGVEFPKRITTRLVENALNDKKICISGKDNVFSFLHIKDAAQAVLRIVEKSRDESCVYNVGTAENYTLEEIAKVIGKKIDNVTIDIIENQNPSINRAIDVSKFEHDFNWKASITLEDIVDEAVREKKRGVVNE